MKKKILSFLTMVCMVAALLSTNITVFASIVDSGTCGDNLTWTLDDSGTLTISGTGKMINWLFGRQTPWYQDNASKILKVIIGDEVTTIGDSAFEELKNLKSVQFGNNVTSIGDYAFNYCESLNYLAFTNKVKTIGRSSFCHCNSLTSVDFSNNVETIGESAFACCKNLKYVRIPSSVKYIKENAFYRCENLVSFEVSDNNENYSSENFWHAIGQGGSWGGSLFNKNKTKLIQYAGQQTSYSIPDSVTTIGQYAFGNCSSDNPQICLCSSLTSITILDSVTSIDNRAFYYCSSLTNITIPDSVISIGESIFSGCINLTNINVGVNNTNYCSIDGNLFNKEKTKLIQYAIGKEDSTYTIPNTVTTIDDGAFSDCNSLTSITIPNSVTSIKSCTFLNCQNLKNIYYNGTKAEWDNITIGSNNYCLTNATRTYFAYINIYDKNDNKILDTTQNMGETLDVSKINVPENNIFKLYKNKELTEEYSVDTPISENLTLYADIIELNKLKITGAESADIGQRGITESVTFATDKTAKDFVANIKYSSDLSLSEVKSDVFDINKVEYTDNGYNYLYLTCTYKDGGNIPTNTEIKAFDLVFDVSENAKTDGILTIEFVGDDTYLTDGSNGYNFDSFETAEIKVNPIFVDNITINGADEIDKATQYTAVISPDNATNKEVDWTVDNSEIATISTDGTLTPIKAGTVKITATAKDGSNIYGEKSVNVKVYATITSLTVSSGVWDKEFTPTEREYTIYVPKNTSIIKLKSQYSTDGALKNGTTNLTNNQNNIISLTGDETILTLTYSQTGYTDSEYKIKIVKFEGTKTTVSDDGTTFTVKPINIANGNTVILALYNGNSFVGMEEPQKYEGDPLTFTTNKTYTNAKIMVWDSLDGMIPQCKAEIVNTKID